MISIVVEDCSSVPVIVADANEEAGSRVGLGRVDNCCFYPWGGYSDGRGI